MACLSPLEGWYSRERTASGKRAIVFRKELGYFDMPVSVPCGQCIKCRLEYSRQWAMRCMHEASLHEENAFITLTYDDDHLPLLGSLRKRDYQLFMKRLRSRYRDRRIRFYHCGEYGERSKRPHYHALLFGFDFPDKVPWTCREGNQVWRSSALEGLWTAGLSEIGEVTFESAAYCARYMVGKFKSKDKEEVEKYYGGREPEYCTMSRGGKNGHGIGSEWFEKYRCEVYAQDSVIVRGKEVKPPKYYDALFDIAEPQKMAAIKRKRKRNVKEEEARGKRAMAEKEVTEAGIALYARGEL